MISSNPLVSVVLACYNGELFLKEQLASLEFQTYLNLEVIIVDDGSSDGSINYLSSYVVGRENYHLIRNSFNCGVVATFNRAISLARGSYIALCDQDDIWFPDKIKTLVENIGDNLLIHSDANLIDSSGVIIGKSYFNLYKHNMSNYAEYLIENNVTGCTCLFKTDLLNDIDDVFPVGVTVHDRILAILAAKKDKLVYLPKVLMGYRQHANNQVGAVANVIEYKESLERHLQDLDVLAKLPYFMNDSDILFARQYHYVLLGKEVLNMQLIVWVIRKLGIIFFFKFMIKTVLK